jgi:hypothetical protein
MTRHKDKYKKCNCGNPLWEWVDDDTIKILGQKGQDYEVRFIDIDLVCNQCGKRVCARSDIAETIENLFQRTSKTVKSISTTSIEEKPYSLISNFDKKTISKNLSEKQKEIFRILTEGGQKIGEDEMAQKIGLPKEIISHHIAAITAEIKKIKPNFGTRTTEFLEK